jgi:8-hydroxy-5-deazaflavin:NADPH oxidoreductase
MASISIIGSGNMARGIGTRMTAAGHDVQIVDRDPAKAGELAERLEGGATSGSLGEALTGDLVVLALPFDAATSVVQEHGDALGGKVIVDITNPVDFATWAGLVVPPDTSGAQEIAKLAPSSASVVKAFNTTFAGTLEAGEVDGQPLDVFVAGDDENAKAAVTAAVEAAGLRALDVGDLAKAHWLEGMGLLHMGLQMARGTNFATALKLVGG